MNENFCIIAINSKISTPFEILINDVKVLRYDGDGTLDAVSQINDLITREINSIVIILKPRNNNTEIPVAINDGFSFQILYVIENGSDSVRLIKEVKLNMASAQKEITIRDSFKVAAFEYAKGWVNSENLINEDKEKMLSNVKNYYSQLYQMLESGDVSGYMKVVQRRNEEVLKSFNNSSEIKEENEELKRRILDAKGKMIPINFNNYFLKFYGEGKMVTLEDKDGDSPLFYKNDKYTDHFGVILHRPKPGAPLEIIR